ILCALMHGNIAMAQNNNSAGKGLDKTEKSSKEAETQDQTAVLETKLDTSKAVKKESSYEIETGQGEGATREIIAKDRSSIQKDVENSFEEVSATQDTNIVIIQKNSGINDENSKDISANFTLSSGTQDYPINDLGYRWVSIWISDPSSIPSNAVVTNVEYRLRIHNDANPSAFYCGDYEIYLSSQANGGPNKYLSVYGALGGITDGGYDDDAEDDSDIYLNWRSTTQFNGEDPTQEWSVWVEDTAEEDSGMLQYIEFRIYYYSEEKPDLTNPTVSFTSGTIYEGSEFWAGPWIKNEGDDGAYESHARFFLSTDNDFDVSDDYEVLPKKLVPSLMPDAQMQLDWTFTFPDLNGQDIDVCYDVWLVTWVDCDDENDELNESNIYKTNNPILVSDPIDLANLEPYQPSGWDDVIVVSSVQGTTTDDSNLIEGNTIYYDYAYKNNSTVDITQTFHTNILIDGNVVFTSNKDGLAANYYGYGLDREAVVTGEGWHTISIVIDTDGEVDESDEDDNVYERQFYLNPDISPPDISVYPVEIDIYQ
ncbi:hypothetical protein ACFL6P_08325, partial [Candidatus Latescibacterota bacterium]